MKSPRASVSSHQAGLFAILILTSSLAVSCGSKRKDPPAAPIKVAAVEVEQSSHALTAPQPQALLVVGATPLAAPDTALQTRLSTNLGYQVTVVTGTAVTAASATGKNLVVISESVTDSLSVTQVGNKLRTVTVPVMVLEPFLFDDMGMTGGTNNTNYGRSAATQTSVAITTAGHAMAAGLTGTVTFASTPAQQIGWGNPPATAEKVASVTGTASQATIFGYVTGATMASGSATARRVGWFAPAASIPLLTANGWALFDAATRWATVDDAVFIVGSATLTVGEIAIKNRLENATLKMKVRTIVATSVNTTNVVPAKLIVISDSVPSASSNIASLVDVTIPIMSLSALNFAGLKLTDSASGSAGTTGNNQKLTIKMPGHPLAGGLTGDPQVTTLDRTFEWGLNTRLGPGAIQIATLFVATHDSPRVVIFAYPLGGLRRNGAVAGTAAPARRLGWYATSASMANTVPTAGAWSLFDAAVNWAKEPAIDSGCEAMTNGTACTDSADLCSVGKTCFNQVCTGGTPVVCPGADQCNTVAACVPATGCPAPIAKDNGTTCNDGNACTQTDTCQSGQCTGGTPVVCPGADQCHTVDACVPATGCPAPVAKDDGTTCNDGNACTQTDTCQSGQCSGGSAVVCAGGDQCNTVGACVPATGCPAPVAMNNGTPCTDGNLCTTSAACNGGTCTPTASVTCPVASDACHDPGTCSPATGVCSPETLKPGVSCDGQTVPFVVRIDPQGYPGAISVRGLAGATAGAPHDWALLTGTYVAANNVSFEYGTSDQDLGTFTVTAQEVRLDPIAQRHFEPPVDGCTDPSPTVPCKTVRAKVSAISLVSNGYTGAISVPGVGGFEAGSLPLLVGRSYRLIDQRTKSPDAPTVDFTSDDAPSFGVDFDGNVQPFPLTAPASGREVERSLSFSGQTITTKTAPLTVDMHGYQGRVSVWGVASFGPQTTTFAVLKNRNYHMLEQDSFPLVGESPPWSENGPDLKIDANGVPSVPTGSSAANSFYVADGILHAKVDPFTLDHAGYKGNLGVFTPGISNDTITFPLLRGRRYALVWNDGLFIRGYQSFSPRPCDAWFCGARDLTIDANGVASLTDQAPNYFTLTTSPNRITPHTSRVILTPPTSNNYLCLDGYVCSTNGQPLDVTVIKGLTYTVKTSSGPGVPLTVDPTGNCSSTSLPADSGGSVLVTCLPDAVPPPPTNLTITALSGSQLRATWTDNSGGAASFVLERSDVEGPTFQWTYVTQIPAGTSNFTDEGREPERTYYYRIVAVNAAYPLSSAQGRWVGPVSGRTLAAGATLLTTTTVGTIKINTNGYLGQICIGGVGCVWGEPSKTFPVSPGTYSIGAAYSEGNAGEGTSLGQLIVTPQGNSMISRFFTVPENADGSAGDTFVAKTTSEITFAPPTFGLDLGMYGVGPLGHTTSVRLIKNRRYQLYEANSAGVQTGTSLFEGYGLEARDNDIRMVPGNELDLSFAVTNGTQITVKADSLVPVTYNANGVRMPFATWAQMHQSYTSSYISWSGTGFGNIVYGPNPFPMLRNRKHRTTSWNGSGDLVTGSTWDPAMAYIDVGMDGAVSVSGPTASSHFQVQPNSTTVSAITTNVEIGRAAAYPGPICLSTFSSGGGGWDCGTSVDALVAKVIPGRQYFVKPFNESFKVKFDGHCEVSNLPVSGASLTCTPNAPIAPPSNLTATATGGQITLQWQPSTSAAVTGYKAERSADKGNTWVAISTCAVAPNVTTCNDTIPAGSTNLRYRVYAHDAGDLRAYSNDAVWPSEPTAPLAPTNLSVDALSGSKLQATWADNSGGTAAFVLERSVGAGPSYDWSTTPSTAVRFDIPAGTTTFIDQDRLPVTTYHYRVGAVNPAIPELIAWSQVKSGTTLTPCQNDSEGAICGGNACLPQVCTAAGACVAGLPRVCEDNNSCTVNSCDPTFGTTYCRFTPVVGPSCSDGNQCVTGDSCGPDGMGGVTCLPGTNALTCDDNNGCTTDSCQPSTGACSFVVDTAKEGLSCDGSTCDENVCQAGACKANPTPDEEVCAVEALELKGACVLDSPESGLREAIFAVENKTSKDIHLPSGSNNLLMGVTGDEQPKWFSPGKAAFRIDMAGATTVTWKLGSRTFSVGNSDQCVVTPTGPEGVRDGVTINGSIFDLGINEGRVRILGGGNTLSYPPTRPGDPRVAAGSSSGTFAVSHDGAATYRIPIHLPPGRAGLSPKPLALVYSSQSGNGIGGVGWHLAGTSAITRCSLHPTHGDAEVGIFEWNEPQNNQAPSYGLCLDGKRLRWENGDYRFDDDPLSRVTISSDNQGVPITIDVEDGNGNRFTYGGTAGSALIEGLVTEFVADPNSLGETLPVRRVGRYGWALRSIEDRFHQKVTYSYSIETDSFNPELPGLEHHLSTVEYGPFKVVLDYETREDPTENFVRGMRFVRTRRIKNIRLEHGARGTIRATRFAYESDLSPHTKRTRLRSYRECDRADVCKKEVVFGWQDPADVGYQPLSAAEGGKIPIAPQDVTGYTPTTIMPVDLNGDGRDDLVIGRFPRQPNGQIVPGRAWLYRLSGIMNDFAPLAMPDGIQEVDGPDRYHPIIPSDLDSDGIPELSTWSSVGGLLSSLSGFSFHSLTFTPDRRQLVSVSGHLGATHVFNSAPMIGDLNGDGRPDLVMSPYGSPNEQRIELNTGNPAELFDNAGAIPLNASNLPFFVRVANPFGEGRHSLLKNAAGGARQFWINRSGQLKTREIVGEGARLEGMDWSWDANGDGLSDKIVMNTHYVAGSQTYGFGVVPTFALNTGNGSFNLPPVDPSIRLGETSYPSGENVQTGGPVFVSRDNGVRVADLDGDGRQELVVLGESINGSLGTQTDPHEPFVIRMSSSHALVKEPLLGVGRGQEQFQEPLLFGYPAAAIADLEGDGIPEIVQLHTGPTGLTWDVYRRSSTQSDLLRSVTDSLGAETIVTYAPMGNSEVHTQAPALLTANTKNPTCSYPFLCPGSGRWLVRSVERETGVPGQERATESHSYSGGRSSLTGAGWLGFEKHLVIDALGRSQLTTFANSTFVMKSGPEGARWTFPFAGLPVSDLREFPAVGEGLATEIEVTRTYEDTSPTAPTLLVRPKKECTIRRTVEGSGKQDFATVCREFDQYDAFGFPQKTTDTGTGETVETATVYRHQDTPATRILGVVERLTVTASKPGFATHERVTRFEDFDAFGLPGKEVRVSPSHARSGGPNVADLTTTFLRTPFGEPFSILVEGDANAPNPETGAWPGGRREVRETIIKYDELGYKRSITDAADQHESFVYDHVWGLPVSHTDARRVTTINKYDGFGRILSTDSSVMGITSHDYRLDLGSPTFPLSIVTTRTMGGVSLERAAVGHNLVGQEVYNERAIPGGKAQRVWTRYDVAGRVAAVSAPQFQSSVPAFNSAQPKGGAYAIREYDLQDRLIAATAAGELNSTTFLYDGLTARVFDPTNKKYLLTQDPAGRLTQSVTFDELGYIAGQVDYVWEGFGMLKSATSSLRGGDPFVSTFTNDNWGHRIGADEPDVGLKRFAFSSFGEEVRSVLPQVTGETRNDEERFYDGIGRIIRRENGDGTTTYTPSPAGLRRVASPGVTVVKEYDEIGRLRRDTLSASAAPKDLVFDTAYDSAGRVDTLNYPNSGLNNRFGIKYRYSQGSDEGGFLLGVDELTGGVLWRAESFDPLGKVSQECFGNRFRVLHTNDPHSGQPTSSMGAFVADASCSSADSANVPGLGAAPVLLQNLEYGYDDADRLESRKDLGRDPQTNSGLSTNETYLYDPLSRLKQWSISAPGSSKDVHFDYDDSGNLFLRRVNLVDNWNFDYETPGRRRAISRSETPEGIRSYSYDERGRRKADGDRTITFTWSDLPKTIVNPSGILGFEYDGLGNRIRKTGPGLEAFTFGDLYERRTSSNAGDVSRQIFRVSVGDRIVAEVERDLAGTALAAPADQRRFLHPDRLGSPDLVTTDNRTTFSKQRFEPFGNTVSWSDPTSHVTGLAGGTLRGFTGHAHDLEVGFVNMNGRIYDPRSASFLSIDPIVAKPTMAHSYHPYSYVSNNPVNATDPTGFVEEPTMSADLSTMLDLMGASSLKEALAIAIQAAEAKGKDETSQPAPGVKTTDGRGTSTSPKTPTQKGTAGPTKPKDTKQKSSPSQEGNPRTSPEARGGWRERAWADFEEWKKKEEAKPNLEYCAKFPDNCLYRYRSPFEAAVGGPGTVLTRTQARNMQTIDNVIKNNAKPHDFSGVRSELAGRRIPDGRGGYYDHVTEMRQSVVALERAAKGLQGSLENPNLLPPVRATLQSGVDRAMDMVVKMKDALAGK
jgi:RHS repeat-associated protein